MKKLFIPITGILTILLARIILLHDPSIHELFVPQMNSGVVWVVLIGGILIAIITKLGGPNSTMTI